MALRLLVHTYNATSSVLKRLGATELAFMAADRAVQIATQVDAPLLISAACYRLANVFLPAGRLVETKEICLAAVGALEPVGAGNVVPKVHVRLRISAAGPR